MINFFRKIRKQLSAENKFGKYTRYAIGEVILVVLGILIALSINNWNDSRKERFKEKEILVTLKNDLKTNIDILHSDISRLEYNMRACDFLIDVIAYKKPMADSLPRYFHTVRFMAHSNLSSTAYESLKSTGFDIIENSALRNEIIKLYEVTYSKMTESLSRIMDLSGEINANYYIMNFESFGGTSMPNNYDKVINDPVYKNIVITLKSRHSWSIDLKEPCITESVQLIQLIDEVLDKM